jgi:anthraniloyl-CoA monooxygenase
MSAAPRVGGGIGKVLVVGGGPGGLYSAALLRKAFPDVDVRVIERDPEGATYGWGVVLSEQTLGALEEADRVTYDRILESFARWDAIDVHFKGERLRAYGHGFSGISRKRLLEILTRRCVELGVTVDHETGFDDMSALADYDLVVAADGLNSAIRTAAAEHFRPSFDTRSAKYIWYGTTRRPEMFTYLVKPTEWGVFQGTPYPYADDRSTFVIECSEDTWRRSGLEVMSEEESREFCEKIFADFLDGHPLLSNRSLWMNFVTVKNRTWFKDNVVLVGDSAHTVHFSIGSGTKLAMEDAIGLVDALTKHERLPEALAYYENGRLPVADGFQEAALQSLLWFEALDRNMSLEPEQFMFNFLTRSGRITYDDVRQRDPVFAGLFDRWFARTARRSTAPVLITPAPLFTPLRLPPAALGAGAEAGAGAGARAGAGPGATNDASAGAGTLANRAVLPLGVDMAEGDGDPGPRHRRAVLHRVEGGAGAVLTDVLAVCADGRVTPRDAGLWNDEQERRWTEIVRAAREAGDALLVARLGHAGPRGATLPRAHGIDRPLPAGAWPLLAPTDRPYARHGRRPKAMDRDDMAAVTDHFKEAALRAARAGFDALEIHAGHGYLLGAFLSPLTNTRADEYGGADVADRLRFPLEVLAAVAEVWPAGRPLWACLNATDQAPGGAGVAEAIEVVRAFARHGCALVHLVAGQAIQHGRPSYGPYYLAGPAERVRIESGVPVLIRGRITSADEANTVVAGGRADLCVFDLPGLAEFDSSSPPGEEPGGRRREVR